jgi:site-specific recombinase XerD
VVSMVIGEWANRAPELALSEQTIKTYLYHLEKFGEWFEESTKEELTPESVLAKDIEAYKKHLANEGKAAASVNIALNAIRSLTHLWYTLGYSSDNKGLYVQQLPVNRPAPEYLDQNELNRLLRQPQKKDWHWNGTRDYAILSVFITTGIRAGELVSLDLDDVEIAERSGSLRIKGKGSKVRQVPLTAACRNALKEWLALRPLTASVSVFLSIRKSRLAYTHVRRLVAEYAEQAKIEKTVTPHTLRHSFARLYFDKTRDIASLATLLGHEKVETTAIYARKNLSDLASDVESLFG